MPKRPEGFEPRSLSDAQGRIYNYLRLSLSDRCNLACVYCMPKGGEDEHALRPELLSFEEVVRVASIFASLGVRRLRFTGGEPLVRKDVVRVVEMVRRDTPIDELVMTTNAVRLNQLAHPLKRAGLDAVNISIDSLHPERFERITRGGDLQSVLAGTHAALDAGLKVKANIVVLRGVNDDEAGELVDWAWSLGIVPRFIELMPLGEAARLPRDQFLSMDDVRLLLGDRLGTDDEGESENGKGPANYIHAADGSDRRVGFIHAVSNDFCASCNRVRVTAMGDIRACLADRKALSLRDMMREGANDLDIAWAIHWALNAKSDGHRFELNGGEHEAVGMSLIGG